MSEETQIPQQLAKLTQQLTDSLLDTSPAKVACEQQKQSMLASPALRTWLQLIFPISDLKSIWVFFFFPFNDRNSVSWTLEPSFAEQRSLASPIFIKHNNIYAKKTHINNTCPAKVTCGCPYAFPNFSLSNIAENDFHLQCTIPLKTKCIRYSHILLVLLFIHFLPNNKLLQKICWFQKIWCLLKFVTY